MDSAAVLYASDTVLNELGLEARGDLFSLRSFCEHQERQVDEQEATDKREQRKQLLIQQLRLRNSKPHASRSRSRNSQGTTETVLKKTRTFQIGWLHYIPEKSKYVAVRQTTGGGTRNLAMPATSSRDDIIDEARDLFFPGGNSRFGQWEEMACELANFQGDVISEIIGPEHVPFTLQSYFDLHKLSRARLYLQTRKKEVQSLQAPDGGDSDNELLTNMLGTSEERWELRMEQDQAYEESLAADRKKTATREAALAEEIRKTKEAEDIRFARQSRLPDEPAVDEPGRVLVRVRHISQGQITRAFHFSDSVASVYDWTGSLQLAPVYFSLCRSPGEAVDPSVPVSEVGDQVLFMEERTEPPLLAAEDPEINFKGFGEVAGGETPGETPPGQLLVEDSDSDRESGSKSKEELQGGAENEPPGRNKNDSDAGRDFRRWFADVLARQPTSVIDIHEDDDNESADVQMVTVARKSIIRDVVKLYENPSITQRRLHVTFEGEVGRDFGGVTQDMFTSFWDAAFGECFDGDTIMVPFVPPHRMLACKSTFQVLGRVITHAWALTKQIPVRFNEASFIAALHGEEAVSNETLQTSFLQYLTQFERDAVNSVLRGEGKDASNDDSLLGIYERFGMTCAPATSSTQLQEHIVEMARAEFVYKPMPLLLWIKEGMQDNRGASICEKLSVDKIKSLYEVLLPTNERVLQSLTSSEDLRPEQSRVYNFLKIYLGSAGSELLQSFLRFVTASTVSPQRPITIAFNASFGLRRAPSSSTCSCTLFLPTTYGSFAEFKKEFNLVLTQDESYEMGHL